MDLMEMREMEMEVATAIMGWFCVTETEEEEQKQELAKRERERERVVSGGSVWMVSRGGDSNVLQVCGTPYSVKSTIEGACV